MGYGSIKREKKPPIAHPDIGSGSCKRTSEGGQTIPVIETTGVEPGASPIHSALHPEANRRILEEAVRQGPEPEASPRGS